MFRKEREGRLIAGFIGESGFTIVALRIGEAVVRKCVAESLEAHGERIACDRIGTEDGYPPMTEGKQFGSDLIAHCPVINRNGRCAGQVRGFRVHRGKHNGNIQVTDRTDPVINQTSDEDNALDSVLAGQAKRGLELIILFVDVFRNETVLQGGRPVQNRPISPL